LPSPLRDPILKVGPVAATASRGFSDAAARR
jgi:hypothetical protein